MSDEFSIVMTTFPDRESARIVAKLLIEKRLAAGVQMLPIESIYVWKDNICDEDELLVLIITKVALFDGIKALIRETHSYEVPEMIQIPITNGMSGYMQWIHECTLHEEA